MDEVDDTQFDETLFNRFCIMLGKSGLVEKYLEFARRYNAPDRPDGPGPKMKDLVKMIEGHGATAKLFSKWRVIEIGSEMIHGWRWFGKLVVKRYNAFELQLESNNGVLSIGSNMNHIWGVASRLVPGLNSPPVHNPFPVMAYDGDDDRLDRMMGEIVGYFDEVKDMIRRDLRDFPKGSL